MSYQRVNVPRLADAIVRQLEEMILEGSLKPGNRLPPERQLAEQLGVSRPSLREAIQRLTARGMLTSRQGGGTYVTAQLETAFSDPWQQLMLQHPGLQEDVLEFRRVLEGSAASYAARRATEADLTRLSQLMAELETAYEGGDLATQSRADVAFHQGVAEASHNVLFTHLITSLMSLLDTNVHDNIEHMFSVKPVSRELMAQHRAIWQAIEARDADAARKAAEAHIDFVEETLTEFKQLAERQDRALRRLG